MPSETGRLYPKLSSIIKRREESMKSIREMKIQQKLELTNNIVWLVEILLSSPLTDNAIRLHVMCLLQLDLELSVQCPIGVDKGRDAMRPMYEYSSIESK